MRFRLNSGASLLGLALAVAVLAGCGSSSAGNGVASKTPAEILTAAKSAAAGAATVHVAGSTVSEGKPISLHMELVAGKGGKGQITLEGLRIELVDVDRAVYINGSASLYRHLAGPAAARLLQGQWLKVTAGSGRSYSSLAAVTDLGELIDSALTVNGPLAGAGTTTIDGQRAVGVTDSSTGGTLYVATTGIPYPLEILKHGAGSGRIAFNRWNKPVLLAPPANAINVEQLQSGH